jgi:PAS domain S-box-containing protein
MGMTTIDVRRLEAINKSKCDRPLTQRVSKKDCVSASGCRMVMLEATIFDALRDSCKINRERAPRAWCQRQFAARLSLVGKGGVFRFHRANMTSANYRVLFVEDDENHYVMACDMISLSGVSQFKLEWAPTYEAALKAMERDDYDAYLLDYRLGERTGLELLREGLQRGCRAPFIVLTGYGNETLDVEAMRAGAADFLDKSQLTADRLERSLRYAIERARAAEALRASQKYARNLIESSQDMIIAVDRDRRIMEFNKAAVEAFGYQREEVLGKHVDLLYAEPAEGQLVSEIVIAQQACVREVSNRRKNGETFPAFLAASVLRDAHGRAVGVMGISRDITDRKQAEEEIRKLNADLERRVVERTAQLEAANSELLDQIAERKRAEADRELVIGQLREALTRVKTLSGLLPICSHCKKIRDDKGYWNQLEDYIIQHSQAEFTHSLCPECVSKYFPGI